jgi:hypothetical protein
VPRIYYACTNRVDGDLGAMGKEVGVDSFATITASMLEKNENIQTLLKMLTDPRNLLSAM